MKLHITGSGENVEDDSVKFVFTAETKTHRTTLEFFELANTFKEFAKSLKDFPFQSRKDVTYKTGDWKNSPSKLCILVKLADSAGRINFRIETTNNENDEVAKFQDVVEAEALQQLSKKLENTEFTQKVNLDWES